MLQRTESHGPLGLGDRIRSMSLSPDGVTVQLSTPSVVVASVTSNDSVTEPSSAMKSRMWLVTVGVRVALTVFASYLMVPTVVVAVVAAPSATGIEERLGQGTLRRRHDDDVLELPPLSPGVTVADFHFVASAQQERSVFACW